MAGHEQIREGCQYIHLAGVLEHPPKPGLLKAELTLDDSERMLTFFASYELDPRMGKAMFWEKKLAVVESSS